MTRNQVNEVGQHQTGESEEVIASQRRGQAFVVAGQATEAGDPGKIALDDPAARQQHKTALGRAPTYLLQSPERAGMACAP